MTFLLNNLTVSILLFIGVTCLVIAAWMKWKMTVSKGRFSLFVVSALLACLTTPVGLLLGWQGFTLQIFGFDIGTKTDFVLLAFFVLSSVVAAFILRFGDTAIKNWEAPPRVSDVTLEKDGKDINIFTLSLAQFKLITRLQPDPVASDHARDWGKSLPELPPPLQRKDLLRSLLEKCYREIEFIETGWRDKGEYWLGNIHEGQDVYPLLAFICNELPTDEDLTQRIDKLPNTLKDDSQTKIFALWLSEGETANTQETRNIGGRAVEALSSNQMICKSIDLKNYARQLLKNFKNTKAGGTEATLEKSFVDLKFQSLSNSNSETLSSELSDWSVENSPRHLAITGEYGQGKSTALLKFCCDWAERFLAKGEINEKVPLLIELRGKTPSEMEQIDFLSVWCHRYNLHPEQVLNLIKSGGAIVIFEGFDELKNAGQKFDRHQNFNALWAFAYPNTKLIFTGRPNFFIDEGETNRTLRQDLSKKTVGAAYTEAWTLLKFDKDQALKACRSYKNTVSAGLELAIKESPDFFDIVSRPSMLPVVATIWPEIEQLQKEGTPLTGALLIERYIRATFDRKEKELEESDLRHPQNNTNYYRLPKTVRELLTICVAWRMSGLRTRNTISRGEITEMVRDIYQDLFTLAEAKHTSPTIASGLLAFKKNYANKTQEDRVEIITSEVCSAGLLISDPAGGATHLRFPHKQFYEYLIAKAICIVKSSERDACKKMILKSSKIKNVYSHATEEQNSIKYSVDIFGTNMKSLMPDIFTRILTFYFYMLISVLEILWSFYRANTKVAQFKKLNFSQNLTSEALLQNPLKLTFFLAATSISVATSALFMVTIEATPLSASAILAFLSSITLVFLLLFMPSYIMAFQIPEISFLRQFIHENWERAEQKPTNLNKGLALEVRSIIGGEVKFKDKPTELEAKSELNRNAKNTLDEFLYPTQEFQPTSST